MRIRFILVNGQNYAACTMTAAAGGMAICVFVTHIDPPQATPESPGGLKMEVRPGLC